MNVAITPISKDLGTTISGVQTAITVFTLVMAVFMIPGSKLTDLFGRKRCFVAGLIIYGIGGVLATIAQGLPTMILGYSVFEGVGSGLLIPPVYILVTIAHPDVKSRAKYFGIVSGAGGIGAAAGPLIGGLLTSSISWRAAFTVQVLLVVLIIWMSRSISDAPVSEPRPRFDLVGAVLSAAGLFFIVLGVLQSRTYGWFKSREAFTVGNTIIIPKGSISPVWIFVVIGALIIVFFFWYIRRRETNGQPVLLSIRMFSERVANLGMGTQFIQWLILQGGFFVISVFLQQARNYNAIQTGFILTPATLGILVSAGAAQKLAQRRSQRTLIIAGFVASSVGMALLLALVRVDSSILTTVPGLLLIGLGVGVMLTSSVNVVQSAFGEQDQGEISGLSRSVSNLGSSVGTALAGSVLVGAGANLSGGRDFGAALAVILGVALIGLAISLLLPREVESTQSA